MLWCLSLFFFQAEDGIRDYKVTGVQTCALPISSRRTAARSCWRRTAGTRSGSSSTTTAVMEPSDCSGAARRSEERRVGKEGRSPRWRGEEKQKAQEKRQQTTESTGRMVRE